MNVIRSNNFNPATAAFDRNILGFFGYNFFRNCKIVIESAIFNVKKPKLNMQNNKLILTAKLQTVKHFVMPKKLNKVVVEIGGCVSSVLTSDQQACISICFSDESFSEIDLAIEVSERQTELKSD